MKPIRVLFYFILATGVLVSHDCSCLCHLPSTPFVLFCAVIANYNPSLAIDNDDGSSWYQHHENFVVYGQAGFKADFGAHNMHAVGNFYA